MEEPASRLRKDLGRNGIAASRVVPNEVKAERDVNKIHGSRSEVNE